MVCTYCNQDATIKKGKRNARQLYYCKTCKRSFQDRYSYLAYDPAIDELLVKLLKEGCGVRSTVRILGISCGTVLSRLLKASRRTRQPQSYTYGQKYEVDELYARIADEPSRLYITYAIEQESRNVIDFVIGGRSAENIAPLINKILLLKPKRIYTDRLNVYSSLIPKEIHRRFRYCTNRIERNHLTHRTHIKRLSRKTICYSKKKKYL